jgi:hypothetical protein
MEWTKRDIFHKALGEFMTESSTLENVMFGIIHFRLGVSFTPYWASFSKRPSARKSTGTSRSVKTRRSRPNSKPGWMSPAFY